jgi:hypothetical protein
MARDRGNGRVFVMVKRWYFGCLLLTTSCGPGDSPGARPASPVSSDTSRPVIPIEMNLPETDVLVARSPIDTQVLFYRNVFLVAFDDTVRGSSIRALLRRYRASIIGGAGFVGPVGAYVIRVPDPGPSKVAVDSIVRSLAREPGVAEATALTYQGLARSRRRR